MFDRRPLDGGSGVHGSPSRFAGSTEEVVIGDHGRHRDAADAKSGAARCALDAARESAYGDDSAIDQVAAALVQLRAARARRTATRTGPVHLPDLIGWE